WHLHISETSGFVVKLKDHPPLLLSTGVVALLTAVWATLRLIIFSASVLPLTFVLPLLVCVWTRRRWHLWGMAFVFAVTILTKVLIVLPTGELPRAEDISVLISTLVNIFVGAAVIQFIMTVRADLEAQNARINAQNSELEAQAEELSQQNEEIRAQA